MTLGIGRVASRWYPESAPKHTHSLSVSLSVCLSVSLPVSLSRPEAPRERDSRTKPSVTKGPLPPPTNPTQPNLREGEGKGGRGRGSCHRGEWSKSQPVYSPRNSSKTSSQNKCDREDQTGEPKIAPKPEPLRSSKHTTPSPKPSLTRTIPSPLPPSPRPRSLRSCRPTC